MPAPQAIYGILAVMREARAIKRRAHGSLHGVSRYADPPSAMGKWGPAWTVAGTAAATAGVTRRATRSVHQSGSYLTAPLTSKARAPWWARLTIWLLVLIYPFWSLAQVAADLRVFPSPLSPTYGQMFGYGDVPGYLSPEDVWKRLNPTAGAAPAGWQPSDEQLRQVFATYDWSDACAAAHDQVPTQVQPAAQAQQAGWVGDTFSALGDAMADHMLDPENLREYGEWFFDGIRTIVGFTTHAFLDNQEEAQRSAYSVALAAYETDVVASCGCTRTPASTTAATTTGKWPDYPNGRIPLSAMTPLETAPGHTLRPDAAAAFDAMSRAYEADMGHPIAVTDSYRSYAGQVATKRAKGWLAATPGTSNHGRAVAVDLGGGINRFGTAQHQWMEANAAAFGWDLPDWASRGGSKPEPWHWEYTHPTAPPGGTTGATLATCTPPTVTPASTTTGA